MNDAPVTVLAVDGVSKIYRTRTTLAAGRREVTALDGVSLAVPRGSSLGVVGETGSGKSTLIRTLIGMLPPSSGRVEFDGEDVYADRHVLRRLRRDVQMVFQDPYGSLDPRMRVGRSIAEPIRTLRIDEDPEARVAELLEAVGLPQSAASALPHEFSGGQRQRIAIARALAPRPQVLLADEPVSALDVSIRAQVLNLLLDIREAFGLTLVMVTHDMTTVRFVCDELVVMRHGKIVEEGLIDDVFESPRHPYTRSLLDSIPQYDRAEPQPAEELTGERAP